MPIDTGIYSNLLRAPKSVADYDQEAQASQLGALNIQQGRMKADEYTRGVKEAGIIRNALLGATTDEARINALKGTGLPGGFAQADALEKAIVERRKGNAAAGKDETQAAGYKLDQSIKAHEFHVQQLANVNDPQTALAWAQEGLQRGVFTPEQYQRGVQALQQASQSPQTFMQWKQQALQGGASATEQLKMQAEAAKQAEAVRQFGITSAETQRSHKANEGISGGQLGIARERLALDKAAPKGQYDPERGVLVDPRTGVATPVTMGGAPLGAKEAKLGEAAKKQITGIDALSSAIDEYKTELAAWKKLGALSPDARAAMGSKYNNMMLQAKEAYNLGVLNGPDYDILTKVVTDPLTLKGTITSNDALDKQASELDRMMQKTRAAVAGQGKTPPAKAGPKPGAVEDGHRFKGGNPADPKNWEKV